jgi:hypothetical protein
MEGSSLLGILRYSWRDLKEIRFEDVYGIHLASDIV